MKRIYALAVIVAIVLVGAYTVLTLYDDHMQVGRMWETPAVKPHETPIPVMEAGIVPFGGGETQLRAADANTLKSPLDTTIDNTVVGGEAGYAKFCLQCHGRRHDGEGTVGQSFHPLPGDLRSEKVQAMTEGALFKEISYGIPGGRQPALATTISVKDRWRIVAYVKSLGHRP